MSAEPLLVVVAGPTASGKTSLAIALAERFSGEIVNCDSVAVYRELEIGTAKPSAGERARVPHHLLDIVSPDAYYTAGEYSRTARSAMADIAAQGKLPIVAGGTGLYLRALLDGLAGAPPRSEELRDRLRERAQKRGSAYLHRILSRLDRRASESIHANDTPKLIRAIEVSILARAPMTEVWKEGRDPLTGYRVLRLGLDPDREQLYARINDRARKMFDVGLIDEIRALLAKYGDARVLGSLGYKQAVQMIRGELDYEAAVCAAQQGHRNYAKRQLTWFRREPDMHWLRGFGDDLAIRGQAVQLIEANLLSPLRNAEQR